LRVIFMAKYDLAFKLKTVEAYLAGEGGYLTIAKKHGVPSESNIRKWVRIYLKYGRKGLEGKKKNKKYPVKFKISVIENKKIKETYKNIAIHYDIPEPSLIYTWYKLWQSKGIDGLSKPKGRTSMSKKPKKKTDKKLTKEQQLEKEIELLRAENAYLKKLRASGINIPNRLRK